MLIKQLSVFIENREGRLEKVTEELFSNNINITSFSLADTTEYGVLRIIVDQPETAKKVLKAAGFSCMLTDVIAIKLPHQIGSLHKLLKTIEGLNIEYMYALSTGNDASIIIKAALPDNMIKILKDGGFLLLGEDAYSING